ncbi:MAG: aminopeptidase P family protein [Oscillospiraceae bacterium]
MTNIQRFAERIPQGIDAVIIGSSVNRFYFLNMHSSAGTLVITREKSYFIIDFRYIELAKKTVKDCEVILQDSLYSQIADILEKHSAKNVGIESGYMTCEEYIIMSSKLSDFNFVLDNNINEIIKEQRSIKTPYEIDCIKKAQDITDKAFTHIIQYIEAGKTDKEVALELEFFARKNGAENVSFDFIVVSGKNSSLPHGVPSDKVIEKGDFITMDFGVLYGGYCSDMTRTVAVGEVSEEQKLVYNTVLKANTEAEKIIKSGLICSGIDKVARDIIAEAGFGENFGHGLGHSVGVEIHEEPRFSPKCDTIIQEGVVMTVEPGIYLEGKFGCRIEDMVVVTKDGCEIITKSPKELIII